MKILVDTHIFLWMLASPEKISRHKRYELESPANEIFLSAISVAELMIKHSIGKIEIRFDPIDMAQKTGLELLDFSSAEAMVLGTLPFHHKDPFDRMLIAQAMVNQFFIMTEDPKFLHYECRLI